VNSRPYAACLVAASLTVGGVVLSGCSGDGDPPATSTSTSSTSSSSSTTTTPSTTTTSATTSPVKLPPEATKHTEKGAEAFVEFFMDQVSEAWTRPQAGLIPPLSESDCIACQSFEKTAKDLVAKRQHYVSRPSTTVAADAYDGAKNQMVHLTLQQHQVDVVDSSGKTVLTDQKKRFTVDVALTWREGRWWLFDMG
jgi:hypothetical protein